LTTKDCLFPIHNWTFIFNKQTQTRTN